MYNSIMNGEIIIGNFLITMSSLVTLYFHFFVLIIWLKYMTCSRIFFYKTYQLLYPLKLYLYHMKLKVNHKPECHGFSYSQHKYIWNSYLWPRNELSKFISFTLYWEDESNNIWFFWASEWQNVWNTWIFSRPKQHLLKTQIKTPRF